MSEGVHGLEGRPDAEFNALAFSKARSILMGLFEDGPELFAHAKAGSPPLNDCDTPFAVGAASAAVWDLLRLLSRHPDVPVDPDLAVLSLRQERYLEIDGVKTSLWDEFSGVYTCGDASLVQLHCNFAHHRDAALEALRQLSGAPQKARNKAEAMEQAKAITNGLDLESRTMELGGASGMVRPLKPRPADTLGPLIGIQFHPYDAIVVDETPTKHRRRVDDFDDTAPQKTRVIDLTRVMAGPVCTHILAEALGEDCDVLTVTGSHLPQIEPTRLLFSRGKRSAFCDFRQSDELNAFRKLLGEADVIVQSYRDGCFDKFQLSGGADKGPWPKVRVNLRAYHDEAARHWRGFDSLVQCRSGMFAAHSQWTGKQEHLPVQALDHLTGMIAALGALVCLRRLSKGTHGTVLGTYTVNVSLERTARFLIDELPQRLTRSRGGLEAIEQRVFSPPKNGMHTAQTETGTSVRYLRSVLTPSDVAPFVGTPGQDPLAWV